MRSQIYPNAMPLTPKDRLSDAQISSAIASISGWTYQSAKQQIEKNFVRENFLGCTAFIQKIAAVAERHDHHPDLLLHGYKNVRVMLSSHSAGGVTQKDFDVARDIDAIAS